MRRILYVFSFLFFANTITTAQTPHPCGTAPIKTEWLKNYQKNLQAYRTATDTLLVVPMTIHSVGFDSGSGHFPTNRILDAFCTLNEDFEEANIIFYMPDGINIINNSAINNHSEYLPTGHWMNDTADPNSINTFIVSNPNGNCGYNLFWSHMMLGKNCAGANDHTWSHEVGHHFSLPHPFFGWEGGQTVNDELPANFNAPAPDLVTYDYSPFFYSFDTIAIDTAIVEKVDRSNCNEAGDGFCDTKPDYVASRWNCNADSESNELQTDPNGEKFRSDGTLIMSYANDRCSNRFSGEQIAAMRAFLLDRHQDFFVNPETPLQPITDAVKYTFPIADEPAPFNSVDLQWEPVPNATNYVVQVSRLGSFPSNDVDTQTATNSLNVSTLRANTKYYWRVRAFNKFHTCSEWSATESFTTREVTAVAKIEGLDNFKLYPSLLNAGEPLTISVNSSINISGEIRLLDISGKLLLSQKLTDHLGEKTYQISTSGLKKGMYLVGLETLEGKVFEKLVVQ